MSQKSETHLTRSGDREDIPTQDEEEEEDSLSDTSTVCTVNESSSKMDIEALIQASRRRMKKFDLFVDLVVRVASRISTMSKEEMEANRRLNTGKF